MVYSELLIPFFFTFAIVYGALEVSGSFKNNRVNLLISLVIGFFTISNPMAMGFINSILPYAVILFVAVFFLSFVTSFLKGRKGGGARKPDYTLIMIIAGLVLIFISSDSGILGSLSISADAFVPWVVIALIALILLATYYKD